MKLSLSFFVLIALFLIGCQEEEGISRIDEIFFPLSIGDTRVLDVLPEQDTDFVLHNQQRTIDALVTIQGVDYYRNIVDFLNIRALDSHSCDTSFFRRSEVGEIYQRPRLEDPFEIVIADFGLGVGETSRRPIASSLGTDTSSVTLVSTNAVVELPDSTITNCYLFSIDVFENFVDDEFSIWLAPNLGIVKERSGIGELFIKEINLD